MAQIDLGIKDEDYWDDPEPSMDVFRALRDAGFDGVLLGAPAAASLDLERIPVLACRAGTYKQCAELDYSARALLTFMDVERNQLQVDHAAVQEVEASEGHEDGGAEQEGYTSSTDKIDIKERFQLDEPGHYIVTIVMRDKVSRRCSIQVAAARGARDDAEVRKRRREEAAKIQAPFWSPAPADDGLPGYLRDEDSVPIPAEQGIVLEACDRVVVLEDGATSVVRGAFRLPARVEERVKQGKEDEASPWDDVENKPTAVLPITLLITGGDSGGPQRVHLQVPTWDGLGAEGEADPIVTGHFAIDLLSLAKRMKKKAQTYFIYAFSNEAMAGPVVTAMVSDDLQPGRDA